MSKKILILGSDGMAGHIITDYLIDKKYDVYTTTRGEPRVYSKHKAVPNGWYANGHQAKRNAILEKQSNTTTNI